MNRINLISLVGLLIFPILLFGFAVGLLVIPLPGPFPPAGSRERNLLAAILTGLVGMVWLGILIVQVLRILSRPGRMLDKFFEPMGLISGNYLGIGREYEGYLDNRLVIVRFLPGRVLQNMLLTIRLQTNHSRTMLITSGLPLGLDEKYSHVEIPQWIEGISVFAEDHPFANSLLSDPTCLALINKGFSDRKIGRIDIKLQPGLLLFHSRPTFRLNESHINTWINLLLELAPIIENMN